MPTSAPGRRCILPTPPEPHGFALYDFLRDGAIHYFDQIRGLLQCEPKRVFCHGFNPSWSWFKHPPVLNALIELEGGGVVQFFGSWIARGTQTTFDGDWYVECERGQIDFRDNRVLVHPEEPWLTIQMDGFLERSGWLEAEIPIDAAEDRTYVLEEFGRCLAEGREPPTSGKDNLKTLALAFALQDSALAGQPREIAPYLGRVALVDLIPDGVDVSSSTPSCCISDGARSRLPTVHL